LDQELYRLLEVVRSRRLSWEEFRDQRAAVSGSLEAYVEAVREELKRPRLTVSLTTVTRGN
jgi:hypothetical protein